MGQVEDTVKVTIRLGRRGVSIRGTEPMGIAWNSREIGVVLAEAADMLGVPRPSQVAASFVACSIDGDTSSDIDMEIGRLEGELAEAASRLLEAWEAFDERLDESYGEIEARDDREK